MSIARAMKLTDEQFAKIIRSEVIYDTEGIETENCGAGREHSENHCERERLRDKEVSKWG
jgi:hypothetical protein